MSSDLPDPFDQSNVDDFKSDTDDAAEAMMAFGRAMAQSAAQTRPVLPHTFGRPNAADMTRTERRAADRAKRRKGNK